MHPALAATLLVLGWMPMLLRLRAARPSAAPRPDRVLLGATWILCMALTLTSALDASRAAPGASRRIAAGVALQWMAMLIWSWSRAAMGSMFTQIGPAPAALVVGGPYRRLRHPMYIATAAATLGLAVAGGRRHDVALWLALCVVFTVRAWREELTLRRHFGDEWERYARHTVGILRLCESTRP